MSNVLDDDKQQQIRALGPLDWTLSRIQTTTGIRRETISGWQTSNPQQPSENRPEPVTSQSTSQAYEIDVEATEILGDWLLRLDSNQQPSG
jgi:hypothetical protein